MAEACLLDTFLEGARVDDAVLALRPDYRAVLLAVDGLVPGPGDAAARHFLCRHVLDQWRDRRHLEPHGPG